MLRGEGGTRPSGRDRGLGGEESAPGIPSTAGAGHVNPETARGRGNTMRKWILKFAEAEAIVCLAWSAAALGAYALGLAIRCIWRNF